MAARWHHLWPCFVTIFVSVTFPTHFATYVYFCGCVLLTIHEFRAHTRRVQHSFSVILGGPIDLKMHDFHSYRLFLYFLYIKMIFLIKKMRRFIYLLYYNHQYYSKGTQHLSARKIIRKYSPLCGLWTHGIFHTTMAPRLTPKSCVI